jgi:hypothetical protein
VYHWKELNNHYLVNYDLDVTLHILCESLNYKNIKEKYFTFFFISTTNKNVFIIS